MELEEMWKKMVDCLHKEVKPATGCTEPISLAYASAVAAEKLGQPVEKIEARVSANMMKKRDGRHRAGNGNTGAVHRGSRRCAGR